MTYKKRTECASCNNIELHNILAYGDVPLAGYFPSIDEINEEELYNLNVLFCPKCFLVQTDSVIDSDKLFKDYRYMSSVGLSNHFLGVSALYILSFHLNEKSKVVEIGSNDGVLQKPFLDNGIEVLGFEPAVNISQIAIDKGCKVINDYFNLENAKKYLGPESVDLFISNNCFAHIDDIKGILAGIKYALKKDAYFGFEVSYLKNLIEKIQYDNIYHEHIYYYSLNAIKNLIEPFGMTIADYNFIPIHGGSIRVLVRNAVEPMSDKVVKLLEDEVNLGLTSLDWFNSFSSKVNNHIEMVKNTIADLKAKGFRIAGYGASGRANMLCNICDISDDIDFIADESPERVGRFIAGKKIPIVDKIILNNYPIDYIIIFAWNFSTMIKDKLSGRGFKFITFFPTLEISEC